jgi:hypothetical protein
MAWKMHGFIFYLTNHFHVMEFSQQVKKPHDVTRPLKNNLNHTRTTYLKTLPKSIGEGF